MELEKQIEASVQLLTKIKALWQIDFERSIAVIAASISLTHTLQIVPGRLPKRDKYAGVCTVQHDMQYRS